MNEPHVAPLLPLPLFVYKGELALYFGCSLNTLWSRFLTRELLLEWGYDYDSQVKYFHRLDPILTKKIFQHWDIKIESWNLRLYNREKPPITVSNSQALAS